MRLDGLWLDDDGTPRPVIKGILLDQAGQPQSFTFLIDTGADVTVLTYWAVTHLGKDVETAGSGLEGISGSLTAVVVDATVYLPSTGGHPIRLSGRVYGRPFPTGDEMCILGRDLLNNFAAVVDRPGGVVCLLAGRHRYVIQET